MPEFTLRSELYDKDLQEDLCDCDGDNYPTGITISLIPITAAIAVVTVTIERKGK